MLRTSEVAAQGKAAGFDAGELVALFFAADVSHNNVALLTSGLEPAKQNPCHTGGDSTGQCPSPDPILR